VIPLPDPRAFAAQTDNRLVQLAQGCLRRAAPARRDLACPEVVTHLRDCLARGRDEDIAASLAGATSAAVYRCLWESLASALAPPGGTSVAAVPFAFPLLIVTGGLAPATVPGVLADGVRVREILEASGALDRSRSFGLANALCSLAALESVAPSRLFALAGEVASGALDLPPAEIHVATRDEQVHLRFLLGAMLTPAGAPSFLETGSAVAAWGMALTRELSHQLRVEGLSVLPIPRPPVALLRAPQSGRRAREELAFQAFVSRVLRRFRGEVGEPDVTVAALNSPAVGVRFASGLVDDRVAIHAWSLHPLDELEDVAASILGMLRECRLENVRVLPEVVPADAFAAGRDE